MSAEHSRRGPSIFRTTSRDKSVRQNVSSTTSRRSVDLERTVAGQATCDEPSFAYICVVSVFALACRSSNERRSTSFFHAFVAFELRLASKLTFILNICYIYVSFPPLAFFSYPKLQRFPTEHILHLKLSTRRAASFLHAWNTLRHQ